MSKRLFGIRGAVCSGNTEQEIITAVDRMCSRIFASNNLSAPDIVSIQFTMTGDLTALNPAAALRRCSCGEAVRNTALFCSVEPPVTGSLPRTIRILVTAYMDEETTPVHCYTGGAEVLRPDFAAEASARDV